LSSQNTRALGIDTALRCTGVAVVDLAGSRYSVVEYGLLKNPASLSLSECLTRLHRGLSELIERTRPVAASIEGAFFHQNIKTAMTLGQARGVAIAACSGLGVPVYEYAPRRVKQAVVGIGSAEKDQVRKMVMSLLAMSQEPPEDAADALALAICHLHNCSGHVALMPKPI